MSAWTGRRAARLTAAVLSAYGNRCHLHAYGLCLAPRPEIPMDLPPRHKWGPSADHLVPRSRGGSDELENLRPAHRACNAGRRDRLLTAPRPVVAPSPDFGVPS